MKAILIIMLLLSLFVGIPINGQWSTLYLFEFFSIPEMIRYGVISYPKIVIWIVLLLSHFGLFLLPFSIHKRWFMPLLIYSPIVFILSFTILEPFHLLYLIPFIIVWIICLLKARKYKAAIEN